MIIDEQFKDRVSEHLSNRIIKDAMDGTGIFARSVLESIRLLEGLKVAPSSRAMRHDERELKGKLSGFFHVHVSEDFLTRTFNALKNKGDKPEKNIDGDRLIERSNKIVVSKYLMSKGLDISNDTFEDMVVKLNALGEKIGVLKCQEEMGVFIREVVNKPFDEQSVIMGDWLLYWKGKDEVRYYLDCVEHVQPSELVKQDALSMHLNKVLISMRLEN